MTADEVRAWNKATVDGVNQASKAGASNLSQLVMFTGVQAQWTSEVAAQLAELNATLRELVAAKKVVPKSAPCKHTDYHHEGSLGNFCDDCGAPV